VPRDPDDLSITRQTVTGNEDTKVTMPDNAYIESLNGKFRAECLNVHWSTSLDEMRRICEDWRRDYNEVRPHSAIGNKPPMALMNCSGPHGPA
jgi:putative transposase